jgi:hypothetical protein
MEQGIEDKGTAASQLGSAVPQLELLREKVRTATGPVMSIDIDLAAALGVRDLLGTGRASFTSSIDAALGLVERALPGWSWKIMHDADGHLQPLAIVQNSPRLGDVGPSFCGRGANHPLAILDALLSALIAQSSSVRKDAVTHPAESIKG